MNSLALLVVHGIGTQSRGDALFQCVGGLLTVCRGAQLFDASGLPLLPSGITERHLDHVCLRQGNREVRLYEVYWADLLPDEAVDHTFSKFAFEETTWFPLLNWRAGLLSREHYSHSLVLARTLELWLLQVLMTLGLEALIASRKVRSTILDQTAADVWHYVHSLAGGVRPESPLAGASERILDRFQSTWEQARAEGRGENPIQVIAHSLGSVVAYHGMIRRLPDNSVQRLITIGSPLEKVRFLWSKLFPSDRAWTCEWQNFHTPSDPVSGKLNRFDCDVRIQNVRVWGVGGFGHAHIGYFRHPKVMCDVAASLGLSSASSRQLGTLRWLWHRIIDVGVLVAMAAVVLAGALLMCLFFYFVVWLGGTLTALMLRPFFPAFSRQVGSGWKRFGIWIALPLWLYFTTYDGYKRASRIHQTVWR